jgi:hypothetical protein
MRLDNKLYFHHAVFAAIGRSGWQAARAAAGASNRVAGAPF